ncbi:MAG: hypothetical protein ACRCT8_17120 [Lacipirellulaceae bacterium]
MDFRDRLQRATARGASARAEKVFADAADALSEEEFKRRHSAARLTLVEHFETRLKELADSLPGFRVEAVMDERGWGAAAVRDDALAVRGKRQSLFSRLLLAVSPYNEFHVIDVSAKGAIRNKETFSRNHYQPIAEANLDAFRELVDRWLLDYAEQYTAS